MFGLATKASYKFTVSSVDATKKHELKDEGNLPNGTYYGASGIAVAEDLGLGNYGVLLNLRALPSLSSHPISMEGKTLILFGCAPYLKSGGDPNHDLLLWSGQYPMDVTTNGLDLCGVCKIPIKRNGKLGLKLTGARTGVISSTNNYIYIDCVEAGQRVIWEIVCRD